MSGVTDLPFRRLAHRYGAGLVVSEMVACDRTLLKSEEARLRVEGEGLDIHVVQLAGRDPDAMRDGVLTAEAAGADIIDINMGCPAKRVTNGFAGSALMREADLAIRIVEATVSAASVPVTLKMRLGWDHASLNAAELARRAEAAGIQLVTVHGRTRCQFYNGAADWHAIRAIKESVKIPVVANGDLLRAEDAPAMLAASGADAVMIGRGAYGQPWIVAQTGRGSRWAHAAAGSSRRRRSAIRARTLRGDALALRNRQGRAHRAKAPRLVPRPIENVSAGGASRRAPARRPTRVPSSGFWSPPSPTPSKRLRHEHGGAIAVRGCRQRGSERAAASRS